MDNNLRQYIWEIIEETVSNLKDDNEDYHKLINDRETLATVVADILNRLSESEQETYEQYQNTNHLVWGMEKAHIYLRGFRDCYKLFKWLQL